MSSMGFIMMNWSSELMTQVKRKRRQNDELEDIDSKEWKRFQTSGGRQMKCNQHEVTSENYLMKIASLESELELTRTQHEEIKKKLDISKSSLSASAQREKKLKSQNDSLQLEEAQTRYELNELKRTFDEDLNRREQEHGNQMQLLEKVMPEKDAEWRRQQEALQCQLSNAMMHTLEQKSIENMTKTQLEQELSSLAMVMDMRSEELQQERKMNSELVQRVERIYYLESELGKARQRVEEMNLVIQNKMVAEKELIDMSEALANDLSKSRQEVLSLRHKLENKQYLHNQTVGAVTSMQQHEQRQPCSMSSDYYSLTESGSTSIELGQKINSHRKESCGKPDPSLVLGVVEKNDSVAWMLHVPDSPKTITKWRRHNW